MPSPKVPLPLPLPPPQAKAAKRLHDFQAKYADILARRRHQVRLVERARGSPARRARHLTLLSPSPATPDHLHQLERLVSISKVSRTSLFLPGTGTLLGHAQRQGSLMALMGGSGSSTTDAATALGVEKGASRSHSGGGGLLSRLGLALSTGSRSSNASSVSAEALAELQAQLGTRSNESSFSGRGCMGGSNRVAPSDAV
jgi:hypothetical protein